MPHLSPMSWLLIPITMWVLLLLISSAMWWQQTPKLSPISPDLSKSKPNNWTWS
nr:ATP synthase F0 subunit 8 [Pherusa bengalensis]